MLNRAEFRGATLAVAGILGCVYVLISLPVGLPGELLLQTLRFHLVAVGLVVGVLAMLLGARMRGALFLCVVLLSGLHGANFVRHYYARMTDLPGEPVAQFDFLNFNVLAGNPEADRLVDRVLADPPDVMLVMESRAIQPYLDRLATVLPYRIGCSDERCDISLHSRFPFIEQEINPLPPFFRERYIRAQIEVDGAGITIVGVHLSKPYFDEASLGELGYISRRLQEIEGPVLLSGDFNAAPWSAPVARLGHSRQLVPAPWPAATWPTELGPLGVPIDNVFTIGNARLLSLRAGDNIGSNHLPLRADVAIYAD
jgi:endonuclease/exonuclease/phosphatase (EEP) superfamily protein YafD